MRLSPHSQTHLALGAMGEQQVWWEKNPEALDKFKRELNEFEFLKFQYEGKKIFVFGTWPVFGDTSFITDFEIKIDIPDDFPESVPKVFETAGRIPKEPDYHFNPGEESACLFARPERYEKWPPGSGISIFLNGAVKEFFFSQAYRELKGHWPFGDWSHENKGIVEYYSDRLATTDATHILKMLELALLPKLFRQWRCPCGSGKRVTVCHGEKIHYLAAKLPKSEIESGIKLMSGEIRSGRIQTTKK